MSAHNVFSIYSQGPEKRLMRLRPRLGPPDVYPQDAKQEEDSMSADRLRRGFHVQVPSCEHDSMTMGKNQRNIDDTPLRAARFVLQVMKQKDDINKIVLDRKKLKEGTFIQFHSQNTTKDKSNWYDELARGKALSHMCRKLSNIKKDGLDVLFQSKVSIPRAIWCIKMNHIGLALQQTSPNKTMRKQLEQVKLISSFVKGLLKKLDAGATLDAPLVYQKWHYYACLIKNLFEEGVLDRQDFLFELCDLLNEYSSFPLDRPHVFRLLITCTSQFIDVITQNAFVARRLAFICCTRLAKYKSDYERRFGPSVEPLECFQELESCANNRAVVFTLFGIVRALIIDCPAAFIYNPNTNCPEPLCGSPLDKFSDFLNFGYGTPTKRMKEILNLRLLEIKRRSQLVEERWALDRTGQSGFDKIVNTCIQVLSALDMFDITQPGAYAKLYEEIFPRNAETSNDFQIDMVVRLKVCLQWAITNEREGTYRPLAVCKILVLRCMLCARKQVEPFAGFKIQDILVDYLTHDTPQPNSENYKRVYGNMIALFLELQRFELFNHDLYARTLLRSGLLQVPVMQKVTDLKPATASPLKSAEGEEQKMDSHPTPKPENSGLISFIPPVDDSPIPVLQKPKTEDSPRWKDRQPSDDSNDDDKKDEFASLLPDPNVIDEHEFIDAPKELSIHERFILQLPIEQLPANVEAINQRNALVYGRSADCNAAKANLNQIASDIYRNWQKRHCFQFRADSAEFLHKVRARGVDDALEFRRLTYYDQLVVVGKCADNFVQTIDDFVNAKATHLPTAEGLEVICSMYEECHYIKGIVELANELIELLDDMERYINTFTSDYMPGFISGQMCFVLCSYLSAHFDYFMLSKEATSIVLKLIKAFDGCLRGSFHPMTGWARAVLNFIWHVRTKLIQSGAADPQTLYGRAEDYRRHLHEDLPRSMPENQYHYNQELFMDMLGNVRRTFDYESYKLHLPSIDDDHSKFSFVCNAFKMAMEFNNDIERLTELANFCGHVTAQKHMAVTWYNAILELCYPLNTRKTFVKAIGLDLDDFSIHHTLSTFILLLAARCCFCVQVLANGLIYKVLVPMFKDEQTHNRIYNNVSGLCLTLRILSGLVCATAEPFNIKADEIRGLKTVGSIRGLRILQIAELDPVIFPLLSAVCILIESVKALSAAGREADKAKLLGMTKTALLAMCEEEWVVKRVFWICEAEEQQPEDSKNRTDPFNCQRLKNNSLGQNLLRIALRRKAERRTKQELIVCKSNSRISLIEKIFSTMNLWNFRATYYDLKLIIRENSPDGLAKHFQQQAAAQAEYLIVDIARCCGELFGKSQQSPDLLAPPPLANFKLSQVNCYWLIAPLIRQCPKPANIPEHIGGVKAKFLRDTANRLENLKNVVDDKGDGPQNNAAWFLNQQPFVNLILACLDGEGPQGDTLAAALLKQFQDIIQRVKDNPSLPHSHAFLAEREALLLRLNLLGGMFDSLSAVESWALVLFQLLFYGIITPDRDGDYFDACYDMLSMFMLGSLAPSTSESDRRNADQLKNRSQVYNAIVKKIRKELGEEVKEDNHRRKRTIPADLFCLQQLLPIQRRRSDDNAWDMFAYQSAQKPKGSPESKSNSVRVVEPLVTPTATRMDKFPQMAQHSLIRLLQHTHFRDYKAPGILGPTKTMDPFLQFPELERDPFEPQPPPASMPMPQQPGIYNPQQLGPSPQQVPQVQQQLPPQAQPQIPPQQPPNMQPGMGVGQGPVPQPFMPGPNNMPPQMQIPQQQVPTQPHHMPPQMPSGDYRGSMPPMGMQGMQQRPMNMGVPNQQQPMPIDVQQQMHQQQQQQQVPPPVSGVGSRGGRRKSAAGAGGQRGTKRKSSSKMNLMDGQPPQPNPMAVPGPGGMPMEMQQHPSTAGFPHAQPTHHIQQQMVQQQHYQQQQQHQAGGPPPHWSMGPMRGGLPPGQVPPQQQRMGMGHGPPPMGQPGVPPPAGMQSDTKHRLADAILERQNRTQQQQMHR